MKVCLSDLIARVESNDRQFAMRFERAALEAYGCKATVIRNIIAIHDCNADTAGMIYWTSWGSFQILGSNLYSDPLDLKIEVGAFLASTMDQNQSFAAFVKQRGFDPEEDTTLWANDRFDAFAEFYNGPANFAAYGDRMKSFMAEMERTTDVPQNSI